MTRETVGCGIIEGQKAKAMTPARPAAQAVCTGFEWLHELEAQRIAIEQAEAVGFMVLVGASVSALACALLRGASFVADWPSVVQLVAGFIL